MWNTLADPLGNTPPAILTHVIVVNKECILLLKLYIPYL